jgi:hypothetical protein
LVGFTNSDWAGNPDDQKSTVGYVFSLGSRPVTWACKKQQAIALSSAEAEYQAAVNGVVFCLAISHLLHNSLNSFLHNSPPLSVLNTLIFFSV